MICGQDGLGAICAQLFVAAVVEQDDVAAANLSSHFPLDLGGVRGIPVVTGDVPHYRFQAEFTRDAKNRRAAATEGRTEEVRLLADRVVQSGAAIEKLLLDLGLALEGEQGMSKGVIADDVASRGNFASNFGALLHVPSDEKKCCENVVFCQDV